MLPVSARPTICTTQPPAAASAACSAGMLLVSGAAAHYNGLCHTTTAAADCGMATFEDPTLVAKINANLGPEAGAAAKNIKFLNFHVSRFWLGRACGAGHCWVPSDTPPWPQHLHPHTPYSLAEQLPPAGPIPLLSCAGNMQLAGSLLMQAALTGPDLSSKNECTLAACRPRPLEPAPFRRTHPVTASMW